MVTLRAAFPVSYLESEQSRWLAEHVQPHEPMLRAWLRSRFGVATDVDDIVQEAYMRLWRARQTGPVAAPKAFFFAIARNIALDFVRHQQIARTDSLAEMDCSSVLDGSEAIPEAVARNQELALLMEAIQSLPARCREVFTLRKVHGLSQKEIAVRLGISEHTVSAQLTIGLQKCTAYLARHQTAPRGDR